MKKIFLIFFFSFCFTNSSFAQNNMMMHANNMLMLAAATADGQNQQQVKTQIQAPIVVHIQYQPDGTPVVTSSAPIQVQTLMPQTPQVQQCPPQDSKIGEILLALVLGCFVGWAIREMFVRMK